MSDFGFDLFPSETFDRDGRRVRPGNRVRVTVNGEDVIGEVAGWGGRRGIEVTFDRYPWMVAVPSNELTRVDEASTDPLTVGLSFVTTDPHPAALISPIGRRDIQRRLGATSKDPKLADVLEKAPSSASGSGENSRSWAERASSVLSNYDEEERYRRVYDLFDMPMLRRVLDEAVLPASVERLIPVVTDQEEPHETDTAGLVPLMEWWLRGRGHLGDDPQVRKIDRMTDPITITQLPHQIDAVIYQVGRSLPERLDGVSQASVVIAGGTPAMMYGTLIGADRALGSSNVIAVQVPDDLKLATGERRSQPLIEMSLADSLLGRSDR